MNRVVAAAAGARKDCAGEADRESRVQAPIFAHPQFERLEAEGAGSAAASRLREAVELISQAAQ